MANERATYWGKMPKQDIRGRVFEALSENVDFYSEEAIGVPGSHLDSQVFSNDAPFLDEAPYLSAMVSNPNHIGCHTLGESESFFKGTHQIEKELISICAHKIMRGDESEEFDGYVSSGGTEANIQAAWMYRNEFKKEHKLSNEEICILCSEDSHYSVFKASGLLSIRIKTVKVGDADRKVIPSEVEKTIQEAIDEGIKAFVVYANMMTTMFGSVDDPDVYTNAIEAAGLHYHLHVDGAYGGFFFPFTTANHQLDFRNPKVSSITMDAHKMVQAPYGTGIFLSRKSLLQHTATLEASYVEGADFTLVGSRSGANAIAIWMILMTYGRFGWEEKVMRLERRAEWLSAHLKAMGVEHYRTENSNIVTMRSEGIDPSLIKRFGLVPDNHNNPAWLKIVVMDHVTRDRLLNFLEALN